MEYKGFVKVSRAVLDSGVWEDGYDAALYFYFLLRASYSSYGKLKPGQFGSSVVSIAKALGWSRNGTAKHIDSLKRKGLIRVSRDSDGMLYTVMDWDGVCKGNDRSAAGDPCGKPDTHDMGTDAHDMNGDAHDMNGDAHDMNGDAHDMNGDAHDMNGGAHDMGMDCPQNEHIQEYIEKEKTRTYIHRGQAFELFWKAYPRHEDKSAARKAWMEMNVPPETLTAALENAKGSREWMQDDGRYIPRAAKWLDGKWEDYSDRRREERSAWTEY